MCFQTLLTPICPTCRKQDGEPGLEFTKCATAFEKLLGHGKCEQEPKVKDNSPEEYLNETECFDCALETEKKNDAEEAEKEPERQEAALAAKQLFVEQWQADIERQEAVRDAEYRRLAYLLYIGDPADAFIHQARLQRQRQAELAALARKHATDQENRPPVRPEDETEYEYEDEDEE
jgi:hypothetical protein